MHENIIRQLRPDLLKESFEAYFERVSPYLPNFPPEIVNQWLYSHFDSVMLRYSWLHFPSLVFTSETWSTCEILKKITAWNELAVENWKKALLTNDRFQGSCLGHYMISNGTWPVPPIILNNVSQIEMPDGSEIAKWELIEGHHRLAYLRALVLSDQWKARSEHQLWILKI